MKHPLPAACGFLLATFLGGFAPAATIVLYTFDTTAGAYTAAPNDTFGSITASNVTARSGAPSGALNYAGRSGNQISLDSFNTTGGNAFLFSVTVPTGSTLDLTGLTVFATASSTGPGTTNVSINGTLYGSFANPLNAFPAKPQGVSLSLTGLTGTVNVALAGSGPTPTGANLGTGLLRLDDLTLQGNLQPAPAPVPEPLASTAGLLLLAAAALPRRRRLLPQSPG